MKQVKRFVCLLALVCAAGWFFLRPAQHIPAGEAAPAMEGYYSGARADTVNAAGFTLIVNGTSYRSAALEDDRLQTVDMYMSQDMHLMVDTTWVPRLFGGQVMPDDSGGARVNGVALEDVVEQNRETGTYALDITAAAAALGFDYAWQDDSAAAVCDEQQAEDILPEAFDLRQERELTPVRSQGNQGTCWAFAATAALESASGRGADWSLSVDHMTMNNGFNIPYGAGGDYNMALAYLAGWKGPVLEADDPYGDGATDPQLSPVVHVQEAVMPAAGDLDRIKKYVMENGGVESSLYLSISSQYDSNADYDPSTYAYFYSGDMKPNHDVVIVGWDDHFPRTAFASQPSLDGAFLCRNSWGTDFADGGYFYVSYEDVNIGNTNISYTRIDDTDNYDNIYQTDGLGWVGSVGYDRSEAWFANVYTADSPQTLKAVSFYATGADTCYHIYLVDDYTGTESLKDRIYLGSGRLGDAGYYTVDMAKDISLQAGKDYAVVIDMDTSGASYPIAIEYQASDLTQTADISDGRGLISPDGSSWSFAEEEYQCNVCLKAFTDERNEQE
ncbi:MAG TPA: hypothetical protein IAB63_10360 [Candidatus Onthocola gallistercoris]|uniref:Peptidase C1A papain C-terminal domain-containing protein n=1 Tax=Candidatus Onthocola gallistercoris TaxID=2840876 RepID=A0A9D1HI71_9FIRM|nr:hypothetical protein [Candidatus Onthocola gallistercoris]